MSIRRLVAIVVVLLRSFLSQVWAIASCVLAFLLCASFALLPPALTEVWKVVNGETPVVVSTTKASNHCRPLQRIEKKDLHDISKKHLLADIKNGRDIWWKRIKASTLVAALTEANRTKPRRPTGRGLYINSSVVYGDVHLKGLQNDIPVVMDKVVVTGDLLIEDSQQLGGWYLDTILGGFGSFRTKFGGLTLKCADSVMADESQFRDKANFMSTHNAMFDTTKFGASLAVGTVLPFKGDVPRFNMTDTSVSEATRLDICSTHQVVAIDRSTFNGGIDVRTSSCNGWPVSVEPDRVRTSCNGWHVSAADRKTDFSALRVADSRFNGKARFSGLQLSHLDLSQSSFADLADFSYARIDTHACVSDVDFEKELSLYDARLPSRLSQERESGINVDNTRMGALRLRWKQLTPQSDWKHPGWNWYETKVQNRIDEAQWDQIENAVAEINYSASTLNELRFRRHFLNAFPDPSPWEFFQFVGWGFGYRPLWLAAWICGLIGLYANIYRRNDAKLGAPPPNPRNSWNRLTFATLFSLRTAWHSPTFGYENSNTAFLKVTTVSEAIIMKLLFAFWLNSLAHVSPLLNEIAKSIFPS